MQLADCYRNEYALEFAVRPATRTAFALFEGRPTVFCESAQTLYALNSIAALIWCCLAEGVGAQGARERLVEAGLDRKDAAQYVDDAIREWLQLGLLRADFASSSGRHVCAFTVDGAPYSVETASRRQSQEIAALFDPNPSCGASAAAAHVQVIDLGGSMNIFFDDRKIGVCEPGELAPTIKALVTARVLEADSEKIAFHAATLSRHGRALLLSGAPGAGKSTLALHLAARGYIYCGDDIALISPDGSVTGLPFAPTVKSGAWDMVAAIRPELRHAPAHRRPDGKQVKYLPIRDIDPAPYPVGWVVFLRRQPGAATVFSRLDGVDAMRGIIAGAYSPSRQLSLAGFRALKQLLEGAAAVELNYACASEAADALSDFCK